MAGDPGLQAPSFEQLRGLTNVLDIGCGPGQDAAAISADDAVALDRSWAMCQRALPRVRRVCQGMAEQLPFADGVFGACRADRVVQHLAEPERALGEMIRVTQSGGRIVIADPDQETLVIGPGVPRLRTQDARRDVGYARRLHPAAGARRWAYESRRPRPTVLTDPTTPSVSRAGPQHGANEVSSTTTTSPNGMPASAARAMAA